MLPKVKKHKPIDKSVLTFGEPTRIVDKKYRRSIHGAICWACGKSGSIGAHVRSGNEGGTGLKPSDDLICPLCHDCHMEQEATPGAEWWLENVLKRILRERYKRWHDG